MRFRGVNCTNSCSCDRLGRREDLGQLPGVRRCRFRHYGSIRSRPTRQRDVGRRDSTIGVAQRREPWRWQNNEPRRAATSRRRRPPRSGSGHLRICRSARGRRWVRRALKWPAENAGRPDSGEEPYGVLFAPHGDIENGALAVDQEEGEIARFHRVRKALKCRKVGDGLAV